MFKPFLNETDRCRVHIGVARVARHSCFTCNYFASGAQVDMASLTSPIDLQSSEGNEPMSPKQTSKEELVARCLPFLEEVRNMTTDPNVEQWLNTKYGVDSALYKDLARLIRLGVEEGWAADVEISGPRYRRARLVAPCP